MELKTTQNFRHNTPLTKNMTCAPYQHFSTILFFFSFVEMSSHFRAHYCSEKNDKNYPREIWLTHNIATPYLLSLKCASK